MTLIDNREYDLSRAPLVSDEALHYWGEVYTEQHLADYWPFDRFIRAPEAHLKLLNSGAHKPPLRTQLKLQARIDRAAGLHDHADKPTNCGCGEHGPYEPLAEQLHGERLIEPMKHHSHKHSYSHKERRHANRN